jgi:uncharacterized integral membrane protein
MSDQTPTAHQGPPWQNPRVIAAAAGALVFLIFVVQNSGSVQVDFLFWDFRLSLIILMALCALGGAGILELVRHLRRRQGS